ncbi:Bicarbonate transporter eukaryotic [Trinorchestia longiramus]|nr:Bicarbonate transporter eukaryotic [Trinorchestia longiramus]
MVCLARPCIRGGESEGILSSEDDSKPRPKVKFNIGSEVETETECHSPRRDRQRSKKRRHRDEASYLWRRHPGNQHPLSQYAGAAEPVAVEEASQLGPKHTDDIASHRFDDAAAYHRTKVRAPRPGVSTASSLTGEDSKQVIGWKSSHAMKKTYDHEPHDMFVELCELRDSSSGPEWREMARWIKYEESVEGVHSDRWGKPHVAFLNFHSLFSLRKGLDKGAVLLDLEETDLTGIVNRTVEYMVACEQIPADQKDSVISTLLFRRRHVNEDSFGITRKESRTTLDAEGKLKTVSSFVDTGSASSLSNNLRASIRRSGINKVLSHQSLGGRRHSTFDHRHLSTSQSNGGFRDRLPSFAGKLEQLETYNPETGEGTRIMETFQNIDLMRKLAEGTEATAVLVGAVDFLKSPTIAFVRLAEGVIMDNMVEVPLPVRFMFVLLGPYHGEMDYHEVGRSISTLMSDKHFNEVAYRAHSRGQLLSAINEFLNASIVLPPAEWSNTDLIPVDQIREKAQEMMKRKQTMRKKRLASEPQPAPVQQPLQRTTLRDKAKKEQRDPLKRVGKPFYGVYMDLKSRMPMYLSDIKDGLSPQVLAATIFIFFASLSPAITFGGMYAAKTSRLIGVGETLLATSINGVLSALFACQPLLIIGSTGPLMVFDMALYTFSKSSGLEYLPLRVWISVWMTVFAVIMAAFEGITIVKHLTRFTEEIFSTLVCLIFIYGAFEKLIGIFIAHPLIEEYCYGGESLLATMASTSFTDFDNSTFDNTSFTTSVDALERLTASPMNMSDEFMNMTEGFMNTTEAPLPSSAIPPQPNTALLSLLLMFGTFIIAIKLKKFRNSKYLGRGIRRALGDFGVPISIVTMVLVDYFIEDTYTDKLIMPAGIQPSNPAVRGWFINPFGMMKALPTWAIFAGAPASLLLFTLIMIEGNICQLILSKPERNMKKGSGFHWDMVMVCGLNIISGILGAPFMTPAVVRTVSHVSALTIMDTKVAPGESPKVVGAHEQRISSLFVSLLVGLSITLSALLNLVPNAVLYGVFLYMGVSATAGIQFLERCVLFFMPVKHHPNVPYVKEVRTWKMHLFTLVQLSMIALLWGVKQSPAALCFPFVLMVLVPLRIFVLPLLWTLPELFALDGGVKPPGNDEPDFYEESHNIEHHHPAPDTDDGKDS